MLDLSDIKTDSLLSEYDSVVQKVKVEEESTSRIGYHNIKKPQGKKKTNFYDSYKRKLEQGSFEKFNSRDFVYFFQENAKESGHNYVISNFKKDMKVFNMCKERGFSHDKILLMIEFLFHSEQDYLDKRTLSPTILISGWCNKISVDSEDWLEDKYQPDSSKKHNKREWSGEKPEEDTVDIGEW